MDTATLADNLARVQQHLKYMAAENAGLRDALRALVVLFPTDREPDGWVSCRGCWTTAERGVTPEAFPHPPACPVLRARALLQQEPG